MSYVKLTCPSCKNKHEVSNFYLKNNNLVTSEEPVKKSIKIILLDFD